MSAHVTDTGTRLLPGWAQLDCVGPDQFRGTSHVGSSTGRMYGGHVAAQAVRAAGQTVEAQKGLHSFHCYFLLGGDITRPLDLEVQRLRDGRSYDSRMVRATQGGQETFRLMASYQRREEGIEERSLEMPELPRPEELNPARHRIGAELGLGYTLPPDYFEIRYASIDRRDSRHRAAMWIRYTEPIGDDPRDHEQALTFLSDFGLASTASPDWDDMPLTGTVDSMVAKASIDHAVWLHNRHFRADEWLLVDQESSFGGGGRGHTSARVFTAHGSLVATYAQETVQRFSRRPAHTNRSDR